MCKQHEWLKMNNRIINDPVYGELWEHYVNRIEETIGKALESHSRTLALRFDLRLPEIDNESFGGTDSKAITRFFQSLKEQIKADALRKKKNNKRSHPTSVRYVWAREFEQRGIKPHYHILLLLNKDTYCAPGKYDPDIHNLAFMIKDAWCRALWLEQSNFMRDHHLAHFPVEPFVWLDINRSDLNDSYQKLRHRSLYLAKVRSKHKEDGYRNFGTSQN